MNALFLLTTVTKMPLATTLMDLSSVLVTPDTLEMECFAEVNIIIYLENFYKNLNNNRYILQEKK